MEEKNKNKFDLYLTATLQWTLNTLLIILSVILAISLIKETFNFIHYLFIDENQSYYYLLEGILVYFLYFEFIALIVKYFQAKYHFPLRYFIYIGITAIIRLIVVDHENPIDTLIYTGAILILVVALFLANTKLLKRE
ncbi:phosphate-starvation-inducible protein PsiE [Terrilactibacillus laevilacticus]|uniref:Protein PsiE homolog n=1 Tax=Terrilactibacillus laevilacticus TaxID=1380157 RepID=A0ABW5PSQ7_9BACI|nr:phosphate-starvation-inducible protein PsiE [Terrilactibacillus laevilacticus]